MTRSVLGLALVLLVAVGCARQPEPETRLSREIRFTERELARMQAELDSLSEVRKGIDRRIAVLADSRRRRSDTTVVAAAGVVEMAEDVPATELAGEPVPGGGEEPIAAADLARIAETVHFATNSAQLDALARRLLVAKVDVLRQNPSLMLNLVGHADARGPEDYNQRLSERRAESVRRFLIEQGIDPARFRSEGRGENEPRVPGEGREVWYQNRRVEFVIQ